MPYASKEQKDSEKSRRESVSYTHLDVYKRQRVNRPYPGMRYGFVIDFADIKRNFKETNEAYVQELNRFNDVDETGCLLYTSRCV